MMVETENRKLLIISVKKHILTSQWKTYGLFTVAQSYANVSRSTVTHKLLWITYTKEFIRQKSTRFPYGFCQISGLGTTLIPACIIFHFKQSTQFSNQMKIRGSVRPQNGPHRTGTEPDFTRFLLDWHDSNPEALHVRENCWSFFCYNLKVSLTVTRSSPDQSGWIKLPLNSGRWTIHRFLVMLNSWTLEFRCTNCFAHPTPVRNLGSVLKQD